MNSFSSQKKFEIARIKLSSLSSNILYHYSASTIDSRVTSFTENFVFRRYENNQFFRFLDTTVLVRFRQEFLVISALKQMSVFRHFGKWVKNCAYTIPLLLAAPKVIHEKNWECFMTLFIYQSMGAVAFSTSEATCLATVLATSLRKMSPTTMPLTPPSGFLNATTLPNLMPSNASAGTSPSPSTLQLGREPRNRAHCPELGRGVLTSCLMDPLLLRVLLCGGK